MASPMDPAPWTREPQTVVSSHTAVHSEEPNQQASLHQTIFQHPPLLHPPIQRHHLQHQSLKIPSPLHHLMEHPAMQIPRQAAPTTRPNVSPYTTGPGGVSMPQPPSEEHLPPFQSLQDQSLEDFSQQQASAVGTRRLPTPAQGWAFVEDHMVVEQDPLPIRALQMVSPLNVEHPPVLPPMRACRENFYADHELFPPEYELGYPRIVTSLKMMKAGNFILGPADAVATLLYRFTENSLLEDFFSVATESMRIERLEEPNSRHCSLMIQRIRNRVVIACHLKRKWHFSVIYRINSLGKWEAEYAVDMYRVTHTDEKVVGTIAEDLTICVINSDHLMNGQGSIRAWKNENPFTGF